jgi:hypothetical protein
MRLAGEAQLGYYPTPLAIAQILAQGFRPPMDSRLWTALDPFCADGLALSAFHAPLSYGSDLDSGRIAQAQSRLTEAIVADAWSLKTRSRQTSLVLLNPPYMLDPVSRVRQEIRALSTFTPWVHPQGWLILIVPRSVLLSSLDALDTLLTVRACWRFPDPDYAVYGQVIVIGQPRHSADKPNDWTHWLSPRHRPQSAPASDAVYWPPSAYSWPEPLPSSLSPQWSLPSTSGYHLVATNPAPDTLAPFLADSAVWSTLRTQTAPPPSLSLDDPIHTPLTLHKGHLATLLTAGRLTGVIGEGALRHLVKGRTVPYTVVTYEDDKKRVEESRYRIELTTVHPDGTIQSWHDHATDAAVTDESSHESA